MKLLIIVSVAACMFQAVSVATDAKTKMPPKANAIPPPQKPEVYYGQQNQQPQDFMPVQVMHKPPLFMPHHQPQATMFIIAQPAYVPHNIVYGHQVAMQQQLLNYFHNNPQAKYQFLYGGYQPHPTPQPFIAHNPVAAPTVAAYQFLPHPAAFHGYNHLVAAPSHHLAYHHAAAAFPQQNHVGGQFVHPMQLSPFAHFGQQFAAPVKSVPPIITGFENFSPEQQAQIKAQLGAHLGAALTTAPTAPTISNHIPPQQQTHGNDFMNSQEKNSQTAGSNLSPSLVYRAQFTKG